MNNSTYIITDRRYSFSEEQLHQAIRENFSLASTMRTLNLVVGGANYKKIHRLIRVLNINTSHWTGQGHLKGKTHNWAPTIPLSDIMIEKSDYGGSTSLLKSRLIKAGILSSLCSICGLNTWLNSPLVLHLDHINGNSEDNRKENLRLLCPNCHSQTSTYCGKNKGKY